MVVRRILVSVAEQSLAVQVGAPAGEHRLPARIPRGLMFRLPPNISAARATGGGKLFARRAARLLRSIPAARARPGRNVNTVSSFHLVSTRPGQAHYATGARCQAAKARPRREATAGGTPEDALRVAGSTLAGGLDLGCGG